MEFKTNRLWVRSLTLDDREPLLDLLTDETVGKTYMLPEFKTRSEAEPLFRRLVDLSRDPNRYVSGIYLNGRLIGIMNETEVKGREVEMGYAFLPQFHNRGYASEIFSGAISYLFSQGFETVTAGAFRENTASIRVMEKCGMVRQEKTDQIEYRGITYECIYYAISRGEFPKRNYYEAYDDRYTQVHREGIQWFANEPTPIVLKTVNDQKLSRSSKILELGCGEGRDAYPLLKQGYRLLATDISPEVIRYNQNKWPEFADNFAVLDCISGEIQEQFDFIYAVAVIHMLVEDRHRDGFYRFIRKHLSPNGFALICTMGDGETERCSDTNTAFDLQDRFHEQTGKKLRIASTSCRMVSFETFHRELARNGLAVLQEGITESLPDFTELMYAVVRGEKDDL